MTLFDADVLIWHLRGEPAASRLIDRALAREDEISISVLTITEIESGMRPRERHDVEAALSLFNPLPVTEAIARLAGEFRRSYRSSHAAIDVVDYVVAATATVHGMKLATLNVKHFPMIKGLKPAF